MNTKKKKKRQIGICRREEETPEAKPERNLTQSAK